jgi:UDP-sugar pyrophosphorylase
LDASYPGGLTAYLSKAKALLQESAEGLNPFTAFEAQVPQGESLEYETTTYNELEALGKTAMKDCVFVLVAGGLGERLGYSGIKISLESDLLSTETYLETYVKYIQAMQDVIRDETGETVRIPLFIMTSGDTDPLTRQLLADHDNYGMDIRVVVQDKVPALKDGAAGLAMDHKWKIQTKPHGHGDVHHLLWREGIVDEWVAQQKKYVCFLQDTNALVINAILSTIGVSIKNQFVMNSICIPRLAGEAAGAIARLE